MTTWFDAPFNESFVDSTTEILTLRDINNNDRVRFSVPTLGQSVVPVHKITDIPLVNGFRQFEQDKVYNFVAEISSSDTLLIPAGWNGYIVGMHNPLTKYDYTGFGNALETLNIDGAISSIADAGGGAITLTMGAAHNLLDGQFINITGTTSYNQQKLLISNASGSVLDVQLAFVGDESGDFDTGYDVINIMNMAFTGGATQNWINITAATISSVFRYNNVKAKGFNGWGRVEGGTIIGYDGDFDFAEPPDLFNIDKAIISATTLTHTSVSDTGEPTLLLEGPLTRDINLDNMQFNVASATQFAIRVNGDITNADRISITNSPDNNIGNGFFDVSAGGLNQKDPQIFTFNNGIRSNSKIALESRSVGVLEVDGSGSVAVPIEDLTPSPGDYVLDSSSETFSLDTSTGIATFNGLASRTVAISYSIEAAQTSGASQDLIIDVRKNGVQQAKTIRTMTTMGVGSFTSIQSIGGLFIINPGDTFQLFKENTSNTNNTDVQNVTLLIR